MRSASRRFHASAALGIVPVVTAKFYNSNLELVKELSPDDFVSNSTKFRNETSSDNNFDVGATIISSFTFSLNNFDGRFDDFDFRGVQIDAYCGYTNMPEVELEEGEDESVNSDEYATEYVKMGHYYMVSHKTVGNIINCVAYDGLKLLDESSYEKTWEGNITASAAVNGIINKHGITLANADFPGANTIKIYKWVNDTITDRQALSYVVQLCGCYAKINSDGLLFIGRYDFSNATQISTVFSHDLYTEPVEFTAIGLMYDDTNGNRATYYTDSDKTNVLVIDSPIANWDSSYVNAMTSLHESLAHQPFSPGSFSCLSNPCYEAGDVFNFVDAKGVTRTIIATSITYTPTLKENIRCGFEAEDDAADLRQTTLSVHVERAKREVESKISNFDSAHQSLAQLISGSMGLYKTEKVYENGSVGYMFHDQPTMEESSVIWSATANGFVVSTDGGQTWNAGVDKNGNILAQVLTAIGVNADWVTTGRISDASGENYWDLDNGDFHVSINVSQVSGAVTTSDFEDYQSDVTDQFDTLSSDLQTDISTVQTNVSNQLSMVAGDLRSEINEATQKLERHYFIPDTAIHASSGWSQYPANSLDGCLTFNDAGLTIDATSIADSSASRLYGVTYAFAFTGVGYYTTEWKFSFDEVPTTLARQILCRLMYYVTKDGKTTGYQIAFYIEVVNGVISITRSGGQAITPQEDGTYNITLNKPLVSNGREYFQVHAIPGYKYTISNLEVYMDFASYTSSVTSTIAQRVDDIELSVSQLEQTTSANYVPATWADSSLQDWYYDDLTTYPMAGTTFDGNPSMDFDGTNCTDAGRVFQLLPLNITQTGTYNIQLKVTPNIALASGIRIFQSYYCIENPDPTEKSTRPYLRVTSYLSSSAQSANSSHEYSFTWTIPTTYTYNGYTATVVLTTYDNFGTAGIGFYYVPSTLMHYQDLKVFGTATDYAKAVIDIASNQIQQEVTRATSAEANLASRLTITENGLSAEVNRATTAEGNLSSRITANANSITTKVSAGAIASTINQTAQSVKISASKIDLTGYITASSLTSSGTTTIDGSRITTGTISANRITLGDTANYSQLNEDTATKWGFSVASRPVGGVWFKMTTLARDRYISDYYTVNGGEYFRIKGNIWTTCTGATTSGGTGGTYLGTAIGLYCYKGDGSSAGIVYSGRTSASSTTKDINALVQIPSTARKMRVFVQTNGYAPFAGQIQLQNITVTRAMVGELIVDGSITAAKIAANAIEVGKIKDGAISTAKIADSAVTTAKIPSSAITTVKIADGAISAGKIAANAVTADKIAANAITAAKIAAGAITADKLNAKAIDGKTITGATIQTATSGTRILMDTSSSIKGYNGSTLVNILNMSQNASVIQMTIDAKNQLNIRTPKVAVTTSSYGTGSGTATVTRTGDTDYVSYVSKNYNGADEGNISMWNDGGSWSVYCTLPVFLDVRYSRFHTIHGMQTTNQTTNTNKI